MAAIKIMIIRHAEKPVIPLHEGIDEYGAIDTHALTVRGWQRAGALVHFFEKPDRAGIERPASIFAAGKSQPSETLTADDAHSRRPYCTILPLSRKLGIEPNARIAVGDEASLIATLREISGVVLVSWEHKRIPLIAAGFVDDPPQWGDRYDAVWILDRGANARYRLTEINQDLLDGDVPA